MAGSPVGKRAQDDQRGVETSIVGLFKKWVSHISSRIRPKQLFISALFQQCVEMPEGCLETILRGI